MALRIFAGASLHTHWRSFRQADAGAPRVSIIGRVYQRPLRRDVPPTIRSRFTPAALARAAAVNMRHLSARAAKPLPNYLTPNQYWAG